MKLAADPKLPIFGSTDYARSLYQRLYALFRSIAAAVNGNADDIATNTSAINTNAAAISSNTSAIATKADASAVLGIGQSWQDMSASRAVGTTYTNSTGRPIYVAISGSAPAGTRIQLANPLSGLSRFETGSIQVFVVSGIIFDGDSYSVAVGGGSLISFTWWEHR